MTLQAELGLPTANVRLVRTNVLQTHGQREAWNKAWRVFMHQNRRKHLALCCHTADFHALPVNKTGHRRGLSRLHDAMANYGTKALELSS